MPSTMKPLADRNRLFSTTFFALVALTLLLALSDPSCRRHDSAHSSGPSRSIMP
ncbi:MAG TPA: hypothetical protein VHO24_16110 [Opitutaceae bacterium]|nr:hypothetical protein [Opitutaceae bacterium]